MSKEIAESSSSEVALTGEAFGGGLQVTGQDDNGMQLGKVVLYQGTAEEEEVYGQHDRGTFLDALEQRPMGKTLKIMPVRAWTSWAKFVQGSKRPEYSYDNKADVPPEDLEWTGPDQSTPPVATESINCVVVVEGEAWPYLLIFKRTSMAAFQKTIKPVEARRGATGKTPGLYELFSTDDKGAGGKPYKRLGARALGDPSPETAALAKQVFDGMSAAQAKAHADEVGSDEAGE